MRDVTKAVLGSRAFSRGIGVIQELLIPRKFLLETLPKGSVGIEIGVHLGDFSQRIIETVAPRELHLVDPWHHEGGTEYKNAWYGGMVRDGQVEMNRRYADVCARFKAATSTGRAVIHRGFSGEVLQQFPDNYFDWAYIDGNHLYDFVAEDLALSAAKVKPGGYVTGDDYGAGGWWNGGVKRAVDECANRSDLNLREVRNRQFVFQKRA